jgi:probable F420-dependent oxidoreductase
MSSVLAPDDADTVRFVGIKIGLHFCEQLIGFDPGVIRDYAILAEELGFDHITSVDHVLGTEHANRHPPFPADGIYTEESVFHEPLTLFAFMAAVTSRIEFVTSTIVLPQRQTALVAKQTAEIALLSNHRLRLGVGSGWNHVEYEALGMSFRTRGRMQEEQVQLLRRLWTEKIIDVDTDLHRIDRAGINPRLERPVPIWFGGFSEVQMDRCARIGDGFLWSRDSSFARKGNEFILARAAEVGRAPGAVGLQAPMAPREGQSLAEALRSWEAAGGTHAAVGGPHREEGPRGRELLEELPRLREEVGDLVEAV